MDLNAFRRVVTAFADSPADIDVRRGRLVVQVNDELIDVGLSLSQGEIVVVEDDTQYSASRWIVKRLAKLDILADRLISNLPKEPNFVVPSGTLQDFIENSETDSPLPVQDVLSTTLSLLNRRTVGATSVAYLTSDAGEGKTTLINEMALLQARRYKRKEAEWLLIPISLGGRPFLRFDEVIIGTLANKIRFSHLYYDSFIELVKLGVLIPAFDGFEEMFVENAAGDVVSALGTLLNTLSSQGVLLMAARKAYFEYKSLETQSRLFDSLGEGAVTFSRVSINRWDRRHFEQYAEKSGLSSPDATYEVAARMLGAEHPVLTRPVLVRQLVELLGSSGSDTEIFDNLRDNPDNYMNSLVSAIVVREAEQKWIDKTGEPPRPLLSTVEHHELLSLVAMEMWLGGSQSARGELIDTVAGLFCEMKRKPPSVTRQVLERVRQHALIVPAESQKYAFDHEEFYFYYLGCAIAAAMRDGRAVDLRESFRVGVLPGLALETIAHQLDVSSAGGEVALGLLQALASTAPPGAATRENCGALAILVLDGRHAAQSAKVLHMAFPQDSLLGKILHKITFSECFFNPTSIQGCDLAHVEFINCFFERIEVNGEWSCVAVTHRDTAVHSLYLPASDQWIYDPMDIMRVLSSKGFFNDAHLADESGRYLVAKLSDRTDPRLVVAQRCFRIFTHSNEVNEKSLEHRLGVKWGSFRSEVLPAFIRHGIVAEVPYRGNGRQSRYKFLAPLSVIHQALQKGDGSFETFLQLVSAGLQVHGKSG